MEVSSISETLIWHDKVPLSFSGELGKKTVRCLEDIRKPQFDFGEATNNVGEFTSTLAKLFFVGFFECGTPKIYMTKNS